MPHFEIVVCLMAIKDFAIPHLHVRDLFDFLQSNGYLLFAICYLLFVLLSSVTAGSSIQS